MRKCDNAAVSEKLTRYESSVRGCTAIMKQPIVRAARRATVQDVFAERRRPLEGEEHCSRTRRSRSGLRGQAQRTHSRTAIGRRSMELASELFDTPTYVLSCWQRC
jgi:hypothetical protein